MAVQVLPLVVAFIANAFISKSLQNYNLNTDETLQMQISTNLYHKLHALHTIII